MTTPKPLSPIPVNELPFDIIPTTKGLLKSIFVTKMLIDIVPAYHILGLYPPMEVIVHMTCIEVGLVNHRTVRAQSLGRGISHHANDRLHTSQHLWVAQDKCSLVQEP